MQSMKILADAVQARKNQDFFPLIRSHFQDVLATKGDLSLSLYDLAWVLRSKILQPQQQARFIQYLLDAQDTSGLWGNSKPMPHSALIDSLAVIICLHELEIPIPHLEAGLEAIQYLIEEAMRYAYQPTVAFEFLLPQFCRYLQEKNFPLQVSERAENYLSHLRQKAWRKLRAISAEEKLKSAANTLSFTAEALMFSPDFAFDPGMIPAMMLENGSIGLSPAATAAAIIFLKARGDVVPPALQTYLEKTFTDYHEAGFPNLHPVSISRPLWNAIPWLLSGSARDLLCDREMLALWQELYGRVRQDRLGRVSWDEHNLILPDLDDSAVAYSLFAVLKMNGASSGKAMQADVLRHFQREDKSFFCYPHELQASSAAILHALFAVDTAFQYFPELENQSSLKNLQMDLIAAVNPAQKSLPELCHDKWHSTWTYGFQRWLSVPSIQRHYPHLMRDLLDYALHSQADAWGQDGISLEESAYVILGLWRMLHSPDINLAAGDVQATLASLRQAKVCLQEMIANPRLESIWISKNLYTPYHQVVSSVLNAFYVMSYI
jgi:hypothetical protein